MQLPNSRFWRLSEEWRWQTLTAAAEATGGGWHMPDPIVNRTASIVFEKFYETSKRAYRLRYTPKGVVREGWHDVTVTIPRYRGYTINARPGYAVER